MCVFTYKYTVYISPYVFFLYVFFFLADQKVYIPAFEIRLLLPKDLGRFYRYNGSLTTPPCYQSVIWTLFHERVQISKAQVIMI